MKWEDALQSLIASLGHSANDVAATLAAANIRGVRNTVRYLNPVVRYLEDRLRKDEYAMDIWAADASEYVLRIKCLDGTSKEMDLPQAVKEFLDGFNQGAYPHLELPDAAT